MTQLRQLLEIIWTFFKIGALTFGGGYSMLPMLQRETVERQHWLDENKLADYFALSQCLPGLIAVNMAVMIGYQQKKTAGAVAAVIGVVLPSFVIILIVAALLSNYMHVAAVASAFAGIRVAVAALVIYSVYGMFKNGVKDWFAFVIFIVALILMLLFNVSPIPVIIGAAIAGILMGQMRMCR